MLLVLHPIPLSLPLQWQFIYNLQHLKSFCLELSLATKARSIKDLMSAENNPQIMIWASVYIPQLLAISWDKSDVCIYSPLSPRIFEVGLSPFAFSSGWFDNALYQFLFHPHLLYHSTNVFFTSQINYLQFNVCLSVGFWEILNYTIHSFIHSLSDILYKPRFVEIQRSLFFSMQYSF